MSEDAPRPGRLFDEDEVALILKRATELHREEPAGPVRTGGLSLEELEDIAREAGIDPRHLRRAALELDTASGDGGFTRRFFGENPTLVLETTIPGEIEGEDFERVVGAIHRHTPEHGQPSLLGRSLTWRAETGNKTRTIQVTVTVHDGATEIRVEERLQQLAAGIFGGGMGGFGGGIGIGVGLPVAIEVLGSAAAAVAFPVGILGLTWLGARGIFRQVVKRRRKALAGLMDAVVLEVREAVERRGRLPGPEEERALGPGR